MGRRSAANASTAWSGSSRTTGSSSSRSRRSTSDRTKISDLEGKSQDLTLYGSPECRQRIDCLVGLEQNYGLEFKSFTPVDIRSDKDLGPRGQVPGPDALWVAGVPPTHRLPGRARAELRARVQVVHAGRH